VHTYIGCSELEHVHMRVEGGKGVYSWERHGRLE
jgi:hypothetical protein